MPNDDYFQKYLLNHTFSEDCLNLNIFYPGDFTVRDETEELAVLVWIHGGGFNIGTDRMNTDGDMLAQETRVIVLTIHYRLGVFGFAATDDASYSGNNGLFDQRLALQWVQDNIRAFGGDPNAVTIFGESAGSWSVSFHMISPGSRGLFHRAIGQSGSVTTWVPNAKDLIVNSTQFLVRHVGCHADNIAESIECLRIKSTDEIQNATLDALLQGHSFSAVADDVFIPVDYLDRVRNGNINKVPSLWGTDIFESGFMLVLLEGNPLNRGLTAEETEGVMWSIAITYNRPEPVYEELIAFYFPDGVTEDVWRNLEGAARMFSDFMFEAPKGYKLDSMAGQREDVYEYIFLPR